MKRLFLVFLLQTFFHPLASAGSQTTGSAYPHILKAETYSLNTRNIKALKSQGRYLWIGTTKGVIRHDTTSSGSYTVFDNQSGLLSNGIFAIATDPTGSPWIGTYGGGLSRYNGKTWTNINTPHGLADAFVFDIEFAPDALWIATWSGVNRVRGNTRSHQSWETFTVENTNNGLVDDWVYAVEIGKDGRAWFGTESGLSMFDGQTWLSWNHDAGLGAPRHQVEKDNAGVMSLFQGGHHLHDHSTHKQTRKNYRPNYVLSMLLDRNENLWIGTWGGGLTRFNTKNYRIRNFTVGDGLPGNYILALKEDSFGNLWIGSNNGLTRFDGKTFTNFSKINGLAGGFVFSIEFSQDHSLWVGGHRNLTRLRINPVTGELLKIE